MPEGAPVGEVAEKIVPLVRFPILMRVILPGCCGAAVLSPFTGLRIEILEVRNLTELEKALIPLLIAFTGIFVLGALVAAVNGEIYKIYEGRIFWPKPLRKLGLQLQQRHVLRLRSNATYERSRDPHEENRRIESWDELRTYPINEDGEYYAQKPTRLGNILAGYEQYPFTRYKMSSIFYFSRIWIEMDKEKKEEIDSSWAIADGFLSVSATLMVGGVLWIVAGILVGLGLFPLPSLFQRGAYSLLGGIGLLVFAYGFYRLSLPFHLLNGELFKTIFDLYRKKVWDMTKLEEGELDAWRNAWLYYQYRRMKCPRCDEEGLNNNSVLPGQACPNCGYVNDGFR